jgi:hypothetical protein
MTKNLVRTALSLLMLIVFTPSVYPQWIQTNWPTSNSFFKLYTDQERVFARTWDSLNGGRMFLTSDIGANWAQIGSANSDIDILSIVVVNSDLLAGTWNGFYRSALDGISWNAITPAGIPADTAIISIAMINSTLFAGARGAIYKSSDNGTTWTEVKSGIPVNARITSFIASGSAIIAGSDSSGVFISANGAVSWTASNSGLIDRHISQLSVMDTKLFAVTLRGVFTSDNNGASWTANSSALKNINCLVTVNNQLFAGTDSSGVFLSADNGVTWSPFGSGMPSSIRVWSLAATSGNIFAGTSAGVWRSTMNPADTGHFTITAGALSGGTISPVGDITISKYGSQTFWIAPANGYRISSVLVDGASVGAVASYTFANVSANHMISATFEIAPFTITASAGSGGAIAPSGIITVSSGSSPTFTITPSNGFEISNVVVDGASAGVVASFTFSSISASHTISVSFSSLAKYQINCGAGASSPFIADQYFSGGTSYSVTSAITTTGVTNPAPQAVYQTERYGAMAYTLPNLTAAAQYIVRLHFAELYQTAAGKRKFNVAINGATVLSNFDIYAITGARYKAVVREFPATANASGQIIISFSTIVDNAKIDGIEIIKAIANSAPTIATAASATPNPILATNTSLSALGADDNGESNLTYTWSTTGTTPSAVTFSANGTNAAKATTATFSNAGSYAFQVTVTDAGGLTATSSVNVAVNQTFTSVSLSPSSATVNTAATQQFIATARDQFAASLAVQPSFTWSASGGGTIDGNGLFTAVIDVGGPYTITATSGGISTTASVAVTAINLAPTIAIAPAASPSPVTGTIAALSVLGDDDNGESNLTYTWAATGTPPAAVTFSANVTNAAKNTTVTFTKAGSYTLQVTIKDAGNLTITSPVAITVNQTLTSIILSPASSSIATSATQQFTATARDQFAMSLTTQPTFMWSVSGVGTLSSSGLFSAGTVAGSAMVTAQSGSVSGTAGITVTAVPTTVYQINCGGSASSPYTADQYFSGGTARTVTSAITMTGVSSPAPQAVYQAERYGTITYTLPNLTANASYTVRLHFAETYWTATGKRIFNVVINGTTVLSNYDIYAATGARYKAVVKEYTAIANSSGQIVIKFNTVVDNATIEGIQINRQ